MIGRGEIGFVLRDFWSFVRIETCLYLTGMSATGFLLFNGLGPELLPLLLATFFLTAASYAYNQFTDRKEDVINNKRLNFFVEHRIGVVAALVCLVVSIYSVLQIPSVLSVYITILVLALGYSGLRVKRVLILKNLFTGSVIALAFLFGAVVSHPVTANVMLYYIFISIWGFVGNLIGDLRGLEGDRIANLRTIPIVFGYNESRFLIYLLSMFLISFMGIFNIVPLFFITPFIVFTLFYVARNDMRISRYVLISSFVTLPFFICFSMI